MSIALIIIGFGIGIFVKIVKPMVVKEDKNHKAELIQYLGPGSIETIDKIFSFFIHIFAAVLYLISALCVGGGFFNLLYHWF